MATNNLNLSLVPQSQDSNTPWPATWSVAVEELSELLQITNMVNAGVTFVNFGSDTPGTGDQDKPWIKTDSSGRPTGTHVYYNGAWVKQWPYRVGDLVPFSGDAANIESPPFYLCDGTAGTPDLDANFIAGTAGIDYKLAILEYQGYA